MSNLHYFTPQGHAETLSASSSYSQAVRIADRIEISGQGGWHPETGTLPPSLSTEIDQAFRNVDLALKTAGGEGFSQVYKVRIYFTTMEEEGFNSVRRNMIHWMPAHRPLLTAVGVKMLGLPDMRVEVEAVAVGVEGGD